VSTGKRGEPRVPFGTLIEAGLIAPGAVLTDARARHEAEVRADGTLRAGDHTGSIHRVGALVQGLDACNGWTFWHIEKKGALAPIDELRKVVRPTRSELWNYTLVVIVFVTVMMAMVAALDFGFTKLVGLVFGG